MAIQSVNRAFDILFLFSDAKPFLGITEISNKLGLTKPTVHGLVQTLTMRGFLSQDPETRKYSLGLKIYDLCTFLASTLKVNQVGAAPAHQLANSINHMTRISIWDQNSTLVTLNILPGSKIKNFQTLGPRIPAYCSASGKAMLAWFHEKEISSYVKKTPLDSHTKNTITDKKYFLKELRQTKEKGFASDNEEYLPGMACVSCPVFDHTGQPTAAISVSSVPNILFGKGLDRITKEMKVTAKEISHSMGYTPKTAPRT
jgi:DNA-binding IclR family transcriptional regulator